MVKNRLEQKLEEMDKLVGIMCQGSHRTGNMGFNDPEVRAKYMKYLHASPEQVEDLINDVMSLRAETRKRMEGLY